MRIRTAVAILLLTVFAFSTIATIHIKPVKASSSHTLSLPDAELVLTEFAKQWGDGTLTGRTDVSGPGVQFDFTGLSASSGTGVGDNYPLNLLAGGIGTSYSDFTAYTRYSMNATNVGTEQVKVCLYMNTGFTSSVPSQDTYWESDLVTLEAGEDVIVTLDFGSCHKIWNAEDDPVPAWQHPDGSGGWPVRRLEEVTNIGFQVLRGDGGSDGSIILSGLSAPLLYTDPAHIMKGPTDVDSFFDVYVSLENYANLAGFDIKLTWDAELLTQTAIDYTTALDALWGAGKYYVPLDDSSAGSYNLVAVAYDTPAASNTGASDLFKLTFRVLEGCNFVLSTPIHFEVAKLSDDTEPIPNPIPATLTDGLYYITATTPSLTLTLFEPDPGKPFEECKTFAVGVWVHDIHDCSPLEDYNITVEYDSGLAVYTGITWNTTFGSGTVTYTAGPPDKIKVVCPAGGPWHGDDEWLFTLTFHVEYDYAPEHVWKYLVNEQDAFGIRMASGELSFGSLGTLDELVFPSELTIDVYFIRGDVDSDGDVDIFDLQAAGYNYGATGTSIYDLNGDDIIDIFDLIALATNYGYPSP